MKICAKSFDKTGRKIKEKTAGTLDTLPDVPQQLVDYSAIISTVRVLYESGGR